MCRHVFSCIFMLFLLEFFKKRPQGKVQSHHANVSSYIFLPSSLRCQLRSRHGNGDPRSSWWCTPPNALTSYVNAIAGPCSKKQPALMAFEPGRQFLMILTSKSLSRAGVVQIWRLRLPNVRWNSQFLTIFTSKSLSRACAVQILSTSTSKSAPRPSDF